jgi:catalase
VPRYVGARLGTVQGSSGEGLPVEVTIEAAPSVLFDAVVLPPGAGAAATMAADGLAVEFVQQQYRHCKPLLVPIAATTLLQAAGATSLPEDEGDPGLLFAPDDQVANAGAEFIRRVALHRAWQRQTEPPMV